ncbi:hypothetical protein ASD04_10890 [Devosia sp. Root436]|uniref:HpcH/HpaI aldolase/citrate lyase family protein n=1 Tax=Devosia sp. Root436 TaxID=1736537 RepID=UPI0006F3B9C8|nr:CoA ester lyase [Devosia sp. Root436]KQX38126.1 hypothetical protein ASD04_10890 [Devosia sp. Root436]
MTPTGLIRRRRRSVLFVPGANVRAIEKARGLPADVVILDIEDSVAEGQKAQARHNAVEAISSGAFAAGELLLRINPVGSADFAADMEAARVAAGIVLPKVESVEHLAAAATAGLPLWAMIETPRAVLEAGSIAAAAAHLPLAALIVGPNDLIRTTGISPGQDRQYLLPWLMQVVLAGKACGLTVLDGVYNAFRDQAGFARECAQAAQMGFDGKTLIHPSQVQPANDAFRPGASDIAWAEAVVAAFAAPDAAQSNVLSIDGAMVERLHLPIAEAILREAGQALPDDPA